MLDRASIDDFLAQRRIAVVGVTGRSGDFATSVADELSGDGYEVFRVGRSGGDGVFASLAEVPQPVDGVIVMVGRDSAPAVVDEAAAAGITRVWLFKGVGKGALSDEAVARCKVHGMTVVEGACPYMFLEPVRSVHRMHRGMRKLRRAYPKVAA